LAQPGGALIPVKALPLRLHCCTHNKQGVCYTVALPFTLKSILREKKNYGNSKISPCKNTIFQKSSKRNQNPSSYYNSITNLDTSPKCHLSEILI